MRKVSDKERRLYGCCFCADAVLREFETFPGSFGTAVDGCPHAECPYKDSFDPKKSYRQTMREEEKRYWANNPKKKRTLGHL